MELRDKAAALCLAICLALVASPAPAQNLLESIFGSFQRPIEPAVSQVETRSYAEPLGPLPQVLNPLPARGGEAGPASAYCVRTCDGHYFPVRALAGMSVAEACHAFCPGSETRIYSGATINSAVAYDGRRYADLPNAFLYRRQLVTGCTCNGHDAFGLAHIDPMNDPTLRPGDVVATSSGFIAFTGRKDKSAGFTPVKDYSQFSPSYRATLSAMRVAPASGSALGELTSAAPHADSNKSAQLER